MQTATNLSTAAAAHAGHGVVWWIYTVIWILFIVSLIVFIPSQRRAMNKIAFGRSMFISAAAIVLGLFVAIRPGIGYAIVAIFLFLMGWGMIVFMGIKSYQHLRRVRNRK